ncbi:MAG: zinc ribbon domain-containing protein [Ignavibacteria bacterium]|nr:zinc ribbon domain-containing protein [Ignavibacteria bacterium]
MPTYDYKCSFCSNVFEVFHGINETPDINCPECSNRAKKHISLNSGIIFKGSGFYITDYKNNTNSKSSAQKPESKAGTKPKPETKSEKKELKADA